AAGGSAVIVDLPSSDGEAVATELGERVVFSAADVTSEEDVSAALDAAEALGPLRIAVNCAGIGNAIKTVAKNGPFPLEAFQKIVDVNLVGTFNVIRLAAERILRQEPDGQERGSHREHRIGGGVRRADWTGRLLGVHGWRGRDDAADRTRPG